MSGVFASSIIEQQPKSLYRELLELIEFSWFQDSLTKYNALCIENFPKKTTNDAYMSIKMAPYESISLNNPIHLATEQLLKKYLNTEIFEKQCAIERNIIIFDNNHNNKWFYNITYKFNNETINVQFVSLGAQIDEISFEKNNSVIKLDDNDKELLVAIRRDALKLLNHLLMKLYRNQLEKIKTKNFNEKENTMAEIHASRPKTNKKKCQLRKSKDEFDEILEEYVKDNAKLVVPEGKPISEKTDTKLRFKVTEEDDVFINNIINVGGWGIYKSAEHVISTHDRIKKILIALQDYQEFWKKTKCSDLQNMSIHNYIIKIYQDLAKTINKKSVEKKYLEIIKLQRSEVNKRIENLKLVDEIFIETCFLNFKERFQYADMRQIYSRTKFDKMREYEMFLSIIEGPNISCREQKRSLEEFLNYLFDKSDVYKSFLKDIFTFNSRKEGVSQPNKFLNWFVNNKDPYIFKIIIYQLKKMDFDMSNLHGYYYSGFYNLLIEAICVLSKGDISSQYIEILLDLDLPVEHSHLRNGCGFFILPLLNNGNGKSITYHKDHMKNITTNTNSSICNHKTKDNKRKDTISLDLKAYEVIFNCGSALAAYCRSRYRDTKIFQELIKRTSCLDNLVFSMACFISEHNKFFQSRDEISEDNEYIDMDTKVMDQFKIITEDVNKRLSIVDIEDKERIIGSLAENFNVASELELLYIKYCCLLAMHLVFPEDNFCIDINSKQYSECLLKLQDIEEFKKLEIIKNEMIKKLDINPRPKFHM